MLQKYTFKELKNLAFPYTKRSDFRKNHYGAYQAAWARGILDKICSHMEKSKTARKDHKILVKAANKYTTKSEFRKNEQSLYDIAYKRGILDKICSHMPEHVDQSGGNHWNFKWTKASVQVVSSRYGDKLDFMKKESGAYQAAYRNGWLEEVCAHMDRNVRWTYSTAKQRSLLYNNISEFQKKDPGAYQYSRKNGFLKEFCAHMKLAINISNQEKELFDFIKSIYPKTQILKDKKVKIEDKPYIQGFDVDIYVPELRKGIEFDGKYWHSIPGLKRSRYDWPEEDLKNYHKIKDTWFRSKGIKILHINEKDWNKDKQICIDKCMEFLSVK